MNQTDLVNACLKNDKVAQKQLFEAFYGKLAYIAQRYSKNNAQAEILTLNGFKHLFSILHQFKIQEGLTLEDFLKKEFIAFAVDYIKDIRSEYYVASTVKAVEHKSKTYDLFLDHQLIDFRNIKPEILLKSIQGLVPSQRLIFNLYVIDNYSLAQASELLDTSEQSIKSNLEKARFNLQKQIETTLKNSTNEQPV